jgi:hypothetical protein
MSALRRLAGRFVVWTQESLLFSGMVDAFGYQNFIQWFCRKIWASLAMEAVVATVIIFVFERSFFISHEFHHLELSKIHRRGKGKYG